MIRVICAILFGLIAAFGPVAAATKHITIQEGTNLKVSIPESGEQFAFDLMGQIWVANTSDGIGQAVTDTSKVHARPVFSPDGRRIASETLENGLRHIALMNADGSHRRLVTMGPFDHRTPEWAPDSKRLLLSSNRGGDYSIWELDVESLTLAQITFDPADEWDPVWNESGTQIAYVRGNASRSTLLALRPGQTPVSLLTENKALYAPAWRPGEAVLTYVRATSGGGAMRMLILSDPPITKRMTTGENVFPHPVQWTSASTMIYSADGHIKRREFGSRDYRNQPFTATIAVDPAINARVPRSALFVSDERFPVRGITGFSAHPDGRMFVSALGDLWEIDADGEVLRQLTNDPFVDSDPDISRDGQRLAFISDRSGEPQVWIIELADGTARRITSRSGLKLNPRWKQDDTEIALIAFDGGDSSEATLIRVDVESQAVTLVHRNSRDSLPPVWDGDDVRAGVSIDQPERPEVPISWNPARPGSPVIIRAGRIFDGIGAEYLLRREIVVDGGLIAEIRPWPADDVPRNEDATYIDASEHTVIPGLIDLGAQQPPANRESNGRAWLAAGVTSVRQITGDLARAIEQRESWLSGRRAGPRLHIGLPACDSTLSTVLGDPSTPMPSHLATLTIVQTCVGNDPQRIAETVIAAHGRGLAVSAPEAYPGMLLGIDEVSLVGRTRFGPGAARQELSGAVYNDVIDLIAELQLSVVSNLGRHSLASRRRQVLQQLFRLIGRGGRVATGSGAPYSSPRNLGLHQELKQLSAAGLQPFQVLKMATLEAARVLGRETELGSLEPGKLADLVVIGGDPLADIGQTANVITVLVGGIVFTREALEEPGLQGQTVGKLYN